MSEGRSGNTAEPLDYAGPSGCTVPRDELPAVCDRRLRVKPPSPVSHLTSDPLRSPLDVGLATMGLDLPSAARTQLLAYVQLLAKWNRTYNLTAVREPDEMVTRHLLDSLAVMPHLRGPRVLDVGTGPGLPGIPLAIACPALSFTLLDSNGKMLRFVTQAVGELALKNAEVVQIRAENYRPAALFDTLVTRAFANVADMLAHTRHLVAPHGRALAMKGRLSDEERAAIPADYNTEIVRLTVPGLEAERQLVILTRRT